MKKPLMLVVIAIITAAWVFTISGLMVRKVGAMTEHMDYWFDGDSRTYVLDMAGAVPSRPRPSMMHPLILFVWRPLGMGISRVFQASARGDKSPELAARTLVALFAGMGYAALWFLAMGVGRGMVSRVSLMIVGLLAASNLINSLPEAYGPSFGLLAITAAVIWSDLAPGRKMAALAVLSVLSAGATITNGFYPGVALLVEIVRHGKLLQRRPLWLSRAWILRLAIACLAVVAVVAVVMWPKLRESFFTPGSHLVRFLHFRVFRDPLRLLQDWVVGLVFAIVAPVPTTLPGSVGYHTDMPQNWTWVLGVATVSWCGLVLSGLVTGLRDRTTRPFLLGVLAWILFNFAIHCIWGGFDNFLYTPHWSWALLLIAFMATRRLHPGVVVAACLAIIPAQVAVWFWLASASLR